MKPAPAWRIINVATDGQGARRQALTDNLAGTDLAMLTDAGFLDALLNTKPPVE